MLVMLLNLIAIQEILNNLLTKDGMSKARLVGFLGLTLNELELLLTDQVPPELIISQA